MTISPFLSGSSVKRALLFGAFILTGVSLHAGVTLTFDQDMEGFEPFEAGAAWSPEYGGTLALTTDADWQWAARLVVEDGALFDELQQAMVNGGTLTFDLIADASGLPEGRFQAGVAALGTETAWNDVSLDSISHEQVQEGPVTVEVTVPIRPADNPGTAGALLFAPDETAFQIILGHREGGAGPSTVYVDNVNVKAGDDELPPPPEGGVRFTFDEDMEGIEVTDGWHPDNAAVWSEKFGGTVAITTAAEWTMGAQYFPSGLFLDQLREVMAHGGRLTFDIIVDEDGLPEGAMQPVIVFNSGDDGWNDLALPVIAHDDVVAGGGTAGYTVALTIAGEQTPGDLFFRPDSGYFQIFLGESGSGAVTTYHIDNFGLELVPPPAEDNLELPAVVAFDDSAEGFVSVGDWEPLIPRTVVHSGDFDGSLRIEYGVREEAWDPDEPFAPWIAHGVMTPLFSRRFQHALEHGGVLSFELIAEAGVLETFAPRLAVRDDDAAWSEWDGGLNDPAKIESLPGGYESIRISVPLSEFGGLDADVLYRQLLIGARGDFQDSGLGFYFDELEMEIARSSVAITFDHDAAGFEAFIDDDFSEQPSVAHSQELGGQLAATLPGTDGEIGRWFAEAVMPPRFQVSANRAFREGGEIRFDLIAESGTLEGLRPQVYFLQGSGEFVWSDYLAPAITADDLVGLGNGREVFRLNMPAEAFSNVNTDDPYTLMGIGAVYDSTEPLELAIDNLVTHVPFHAEPGTALLTFAESLEGFVVADATSEVHRFEREDNSEYALFLKGETGSVWHAEAPVGASGATSAAVDFGTRLRYAASSGGTLSFEVVFDWLSVNNPTQEFDGISVLLAINGGGVWQEREFVFDDLDLPLGDGEIEARTVTVPLYPADSGETDGFVLETDSDYQVFVGSNSVEGSADEIEFFFDNLSATAAPPAPAPLILSEPRLDLSGGVVFGRLLASHSDGADYTATGLPPGVSLDPVTGLIGGEPASDGTYQVTFTVSTAAGTAQETYQWTVSGAGTGETTAPVIVGHGLDENGFTLHWTGNGGAPVNVERSTDLVNWTTVTNGSGVTGTSFTDPDPPSSHAFYRLVVP